MTGLPSQFYLIGNALEGAAQNHRVVSQNIANVNTPGYKTREISFDQFIEQLRSGEANSQFLTEVPVELADGLIERADGNNVNIDQQLASLKKNSLLFQTYSHLLASKMATVRKAIAG